MTHVLVVDDSRFIRNVVGDALESAGYDVDTVANGTEAVAAVRTDEPDVVTMDIEMPGMDGLEAVDHIMSSNPTPILMLSAYTEEGADATLDALERGAADFLQKPDGTDGRNIIDLADEVVEKVEKVAESDVSTSALARAAAAIESVTGERQPLSPVSAQPRSETLGATTANSRQSPPETVPEEAFVDDPTVIVGASTGGPKIIEELFADLPRTLEAKLLVVQHMPATFTARLADRLDSISDYAVREATDGDRIGPGEAVVAPGDYHLEVAKNDDGNLDVRLEDGEPIHGVCPAIDVTMESAARRVSDPLVGVVLTGMGKDGASGIKAIKRAGGRTIAQDEETSPVFGIPGQAIETGCVDTVVSADSVVDTIIEAFTGEDDD
ncbi:chemotaxis-specific protein-glutamate methyltransferase CheB [Natrialbaceae archaeon A-gly3]